MTEPNWSRIFHRRTFLSMSCVSHCESCRDFRTWQGNRRMSLRVPQRQGIRELSVSTTHKPWVIAFHCGQLCSKAVSRNCHSQQQVLLQSTYSKTTVWHTVRNDSLSTSSSSQRHHATPNTERRDGCPSTAVHSRPRRSSTSTTPTSERVVSGFWKCSGTRREFRSSISRGALARVGNSQQNRGQRRAANHWSNVSANSTI
jgi:hypothetical protein